MTTHTTPAGLAPNRHPSPTAVRQSECLPCYLDRMLHLTRCDNQLRWAGAWSRANRLPGLLRWLRSNGGFCDCEVLCNVYSDVSDADDEPQRPRCRGVTRGVRDPCPAWSR